MPSHTCRLLFFVTAGLLITGDAVLAQDSRNISDFQAPPGNQAIRPEKKRKLTRTDLEPSPSHLPLSDFVPCLFNDDEQLEMHALRPPVREQKPLDGPTAFQLSAAAVSAVDKLRYQPNFNPAAIDDFLKTFTPLVDPHYLVGHEPWEALSIINDAAQKAKNEIDTRQAQAKQQVQGETPENWARTERYGFFEPSLRDVDSAARDLSVSVLAAVKGGMQKQNPKATDETWANNAFSLAISTIESLEQDPLYDRDAVDAYRFFFKKWLAGNPPRSSESTNAGAAVKQLTNKTPLEAYSIIESAAENARREMDRYGIFLFSPSGSSARTPTTTRSTTPTAAAPTPQIVNSPTEAASALLQHLNAAATGVIKGATSVAFEPPNDVSCSMSILNWKETSDAFGRRVANTYVGIQVTVRNLNTKNEFLIHDIQVAVDTGVDPDKFARFQAGRDKLLVRAVAERGRSDDRRNLVLHSLEAIGAISGSSSIAGSNDFKTAVAVFQGAFVPGFANIFPDHTVEQLNHINDLVFSASSTSKVLVPIQGSVPLVTFIAERPIEQLPYAWCGYTIKKGQHCQPDEGEDEDSRIARAEKTSTAIQSQVEDTGNRQQHLSEPPLPLNELPFRKWKARALDILERRTFVVIGGVHIQEVQSIPKIGNVDCPMSSNGSVDVSQAKDGVLTCSITGNSLDKIATVALEKDLDKILGKIKPAKDGNSATLEFDAGKASDYSGIFSIFFIDSAGKETDSGAVVQLAFEPIIDKIEESDLDLGQPKPSLTLDGKHLDQISDVYLASDEKGTGAVKGEMGTKPGPTDSKVSVWFTPKGLISGATYYLSYTTQGNPSNQIHLKLTVTTKGSPKGSSPPAPKPSANVGARQGKKPGTV